MRKPLFAMFAGMAVMVASEAQQSFEAKLHGAEAEYGRVLARMEAGEAAPAMVDDFWFAENDWRAWLRPYVVKDGILQIPVKGVLLKDFPYAMGDWATGYEYIWRAFQRGMDDSNVKGVALIVDSPGGLVAGNFDLVDRMYALRGRKPIRAYADEYAFSAAYSIASVADELTVARTGGVGSIGVVAMHVDYSANFEERGIKVTFIKKGAHKTDGNPYEPLSAAVLKRLEAKMEVPYSLFVATVARNRGLEEQAVRDTEAMTFTAQEALSNGLADHIGSLDDALAAYAAFLSPDDGEDQMSTTDTKAVDQAAIDAARAEGHAAGLAAGKTEGHADGVKAERARISDIIGSEEGKLRPKAALSAALKTDMTVDQAKAFIGDLAEEKAESTEGNGAGELFQQAMDNGDNPELGADAKGNKSKDEQQLGAILGDYRAFTGETKKAG